MFSCEEPLKGPWLLALLFPATRNKGVVGDSQCQHGWRRRDRGERVLAWLRCWWQGAVQVLVALVCAASFTVSFKQ